MAVVGKARRPSQVRHRRVRRCRVVEAVDPGEGIGDDAVDQRRRIVAADRGPLPRRLAVAYLLTDQAYAVSITQWSADADSRPRLPYFLGAGLLLWISWQVSTIVGVLVGSAVPADVPLDFAVPLVFLVLLVPTLTSRPALIAGAVGGGAAVAAAEAGAGPLYVIVGALSGIAAGAVADVLEDRGRR